MSDADDQMGGTGGESGPPPADRDGPTGRPAGRAGASGGDPAGRDDDPAGRDDDRVTEESEESFPASDPPANY